MKKQLLFLVSVLTLISSCSSNEQPEPVFLADLKGKLQSISELRDNVLQKKTSFVFDVKARPVEITIEDLLNGTKTIELIKFNDMDLPVSSEISRISATGTVKGIRTYSYGDKNLITEIKETYGIDKKEDYQFFTYNENGNVVEYLARSVDGGSNKFGGSMSITWKGGKLSTIENRGANGEYEETNYLLDDFKNPLYDVYAKVLKIPIANPDAISPDNIKFYQTLFEGKRYRREAMADTEGKTTRIVLSVFENSDWKAIGQVNYEYY